MSVKTQHIGPNGAAISGAVLPIVEFGDEARVRFRELVRELLGLELGGVRMVLLVPDTLAAISASV
jgi:hypothetical protein